MVHAGVVTDPASGEKCEVDILKEAFWRPPTATAYGPVLALDDVIGTKVRALADRGAVRDLIDVHAASRHHTTAGLETLGHRHAPREQPPVWGDEVAARPDIVGQGFTR